MLRLLKAYGDSAIERRLVGDLVEVIGFDGLSPEERDRKMAGHLKSADLLLGDIDMRITEEVLGAAPSLRAVVCRSIGTDFVDVEAASRRCVLVLNSPTFCVTNVAEHAIALLFAASHRIPEAMQSVLRGTWADRETLTGIELTGKTLGIIGYGRIGREVARLGGGIGMRVIAYDPCFQPGMAGDGLAEIVPMEKLLANADAVTIHLPLTQATRGLIGATEFGRMKDGAILINVSRGGIVDEAALIETLRSGKLFGAALDVFNREPPSGDDPLVASHFPNLILTPHVAWNSREAKLKNDQTFCRQIDCLIGGRLPEGIVNREIAAAWQDRYGVKCEERKSEA